MGQGQHFFRHTLPVLLGTAIVWVGNGAALGLLGLFPSYQDQLVTWISIHPQAPPITFLVLSLIVAAMLSLLQEAPRTKGLKVSVIAGVFFGVMTFASRYSSTPAELLDVGAIFSLFRAVSAIGAAVVMYVMKRRWQSYETAHMSTVPR